MTKKIKRILGFLFLIFILGVSVVVFSGYDLYRAAIRQIPIEQKINDIKSMENYISIEDVPQTYKDAVISVEDSRFYEHGGVDIISITRAFLTDIKTLSLAEGGSTITQQLSKNLYFSQEKKFSRKIAEIFVAREIEKLYEKDEILELYLNIIYYGDGYYGIGDASYGYFNKAPSELTLYEQTLLAGLPNAPSVYQLSNNSDLSLKRQEVVIKTMAENGYITDEQIGQISEEKLNSNQ